MMKNIFTLAIAFIGCILIPSCKDYEKYVNMSDIEELERMIAQAQQEKDSLWVADADSIPEVVNTDSILVIEWDEGELKQNQMKVVFKKVVLEGHDYWTAVGVGENRGGVALTHSQNCKLHKDHK